MTALQIREFRHGDELALHAVFHSAVHQIACADYSAEQINAWAPAEVDWDVWTRRMQALHPFVVEDDGRIVGYADVQPNGYIDHFFVCGLHARKGVGSLLMERIHQAARSQGISLLTSDVSRTAQPFFERFGFITVEHKNPIVRGVVVPNARMQKQLRMITVVDYDLAWPSQFAALKGRVLQALGGLAVSIEHVGSTAVPGLSAKPIIDIDVVVASVGDVPQAIDRLATLGYAHSGDLGIAGREAFESPSGFPDHHLYVCVQGSIPLENHLAVRECLRRDRELVAAYGALKKRLAEEFPADIDRYIDGKTEFLLAILRNAGLSGSALTEIESANRI